jgi:hypothetical protein
MHNICVQSVQCKSRMVSVSCYDSLAAAAQQVRSFDVVTEVNGRLFN